MARVRITVTSVTTTAVELVDGSGLEALTLSAVAKDLGVGPSALYTHCDGLDGLRGLVAVAATDNLATNLRNAAIGYAGEDALLALGMAYRQFASDHPGQFAATIRPPDPAADELANATQLLLDVFVLVFRAMGLDDERAAMAARSTRSAIHGFLAIEHLAAHGSSSAEFEHLLATLRAGLQRAEPTPEPG
ncbi:MAG: TetR-like C-terminal domain-containing protein [Acidimicrobiales bacterium]